MKKAIFTIFLFVIMLQAPIFAAESSKSIGNWETSVYFGNDTIITRVALDSGNDIAVKLREFCEAAGYSVFWKEQGRCILLEKEQETITIFADQFHCEKNQEEIPLEKPVFIKYNSAYLPQSFLQTVLNIETIEIEQMEGSNRVNGVFLANKEEGPNGFTVIDSDAFQIQAMPKDAAAEEEALITFALGIEKEDIHSSMDYKMFIQSNAKRIAELVKEQLENASWEDFSDPQKMDALKRNTVDAINEAFHIGFVKYIYFMEFTKYSAN